MVLVGGCAYGACFFCGGAAGAEIEPPSLPAVCRWPRGPTDPTGFFAGAEGPTGPTGSSVGARGPTNPTVVFARAAGAEQRRAGLAVEERKMADFAPAWRQRMRARPIAPLASVRAHAASVVFEGELFVLGGNVDDAGQ